MKYLLTAIILLFTGCGSSMYNWQMSQTPKVNMIGHTVQDGIAGKQVIGFNQHTLKKRNLTNIEDSQYSEITNRLYDYLTSDNYKIESKKHLMISGFQELNIKNFGKVLPIGQPFIYQCITASNIEFKITNKSESIRSLIKEVAKITGEKTSKIFIRTVDKKKHLHKVTIKKPNICLAYTIAQFNEKKFKKHNDTTSSMFYENTDMKKDAKQKPQASFTLELGDKSQHLFIKDFTKNTTQRNYYSIEANKDQQSNIILKVCKSIHQYNEKCNLIYPNNYGKWNKIYPLGYESYTMQKKKIYNIFSLEIDAHSNSNRSIKVNWAKLRQPQYELEIIYN